MQLRYLKPASAWVEALPLGNGRLGAMVFGDPLHERIALNEDSLWSGYPSDYNLKDVYPHFVEAQRLMLEGKPLEAQRETEKNILGPFTAAYEPLGDLHLDYHASDEHVTAYERTLSLNDAVSDTVYTLGHDRITRKAYISYPDQVLVLHLKSTLKSTSVSISFTSPLHYSVQSEADELIIHTICPSASIPSYVHGNEEPVSYFEDEERRGIEACCRVKVLTNGRCCAEAAHLLLTDFDDAVILLSCRSNFGGFDVAPARSNIDYEGMSRQDVEKAITHLDQLLSRHLNDYQPIYERQSILIPGNGKEALPTDERLRLYREGGDDPLLPLLLYQFGRYLMISGSRPGTRALNLQGIWNDQLQPPWSSNYTTNINVEMNYWPAQICNLSQMHSPFFDLLKNMALTGEKTASNIFHARGSCANHNTDLWAHTTPVGEHGIGNGLWGWWPMGFGWMCQHLWEHYIYNGDELFLRETALPLFRKAALFFIDTCVEGPDGYRAFRLATSPENRYLLDQQEIAFASFTTMSNSIVREVLTNYLTALHVLGLSEADEEAAKTLLEALPPLMILSDGRLAEWDGEKQEVEPTHRHISHLYGLFPGHEIKKDDIPYRKACIESLRVRGDDGTGWSLGWKINVWTRLNDGDHAIRLIRRQLRLVEPGKEQFEGGGTFPNLFDAHPPFQIDGNFAAASGITRLLIDSDFDQIYILPALPSTWRDLDAHGLRGANGFTFDMCIRDGRLVSLIAHSTSSKRTTLHLLGKSGELTLQPGDSMELANVFC